MTAERANQSTGRVFAWPGLSLWIGRGDGRTRWHAHHAHQLTVALEGDFGFRSGADGPWTRYEGAIVPSHCTHQFEVDHASLAHLFVEPESRAGRALAARYGAGGLSPLPPAPAKDAAALLRAAWQADPSSASMRRASLSALALLSGSDAEFDGSVDPRLARALVHMRAQVRAPLRLADVAAQVALSEGRFRHLFVAQTGCSFRAYLLWLRINLAIEAVMAGASWTDAAHDAGFADSAHLTRTHQRMFGIDPSALRPQAVKV